MPPAPCSEPGCGRRGKARGLCSSHYMKASRRGSLPKPVAPEPWDPSRVVVDYRLRIEAARARVTQALLVLSHPEARFDRDASSLLCDALAELDLGRD